MANFAQFAALPLVSPKPDDATKPCKVESTDSFVESKPVESTRRRGRAATIGSGCSLNTRRIKDAEQVALIHRIMLMLSSPKARSKVSAAAFSKHAEGPALSESAEIPDLPVTRLPLVLDTLQIPAEHLKIFEAVLQREMNFGPKIDTISQEVFQKLLPKALRRIRDLYCVPFSKGQFVTRNQKQLEDGYEQLCAVGSGSFGKCFRVRHKVSGKVRVVKQMKKARLEMPKEEVEQELDILKELDHPNIVRFFEWFESEESFLLVLEMAHGGDLEKALRQAKAAERVGLGEAMIKSISEQSLGALEYIHGQQIIHRDLKPANVLLLNDTSPPHILLADFGIADIFSCGSDDLRSSGGVRASEKKGTWPYMAPEIFDNTVSPKSDVWALGVVSYELFCGNKPFGVDPFEVYVAISDDDPVDVAPVIEAGGSETASNFVSRLLTKDERLRPTAQEAQMEFEDWWSKECASPTGLKCRSSLTGSLDEFRATSTFTKAALLCVASQLDTSGMEALHNMFKELDADNNGTLSVPEIMGGFYQLGYDADDVEAIVDALDINATGKIEYTEFITGCLGARRDLAESSLIHAFSIFDVNGDGVISMDEFREILGADGTLAALPDGKTLEQELGEIDTSHNKNISFEEFKAYMEKIHEKDSGGNHDAAEQEVLRTLTKQSSKPDDAQSKATDATNRQKLKELIKMRDWLQGNENILDTKPGSLKQLERQVETMSSEINMMFQALQSPGFVRRSAPAISSQIEGTKVVSDEC